VAAIVVVIEFFFRRRSSEFEEDMKASRLDWRSALGESVKRRTGRMLYRVRRIDRRGDAYVGHVFDPRTGETVHWCAEPLSEHRAHGSAKRRACHRRP
jgi:hypothetical protein